MVWKKPYLFILVFLFLGLATVRDYGIPVDDFTQYVIGKENHDVLVGSRKISELDQGNKFYGPIFETLCFAIDRRFSPEPPPAQKWGMRHALIWVLFCLALLAFWHVALGAFGDLKIAWILTLFLAFYPRLFADAHYNSKDTVFLCFVCYFLYFLHRYSLSKSYSALIASAIILGIAGTLRLTAFFAIPCVALAWFISRKQINISIQQLFIRFSIFTLIFCLSYYTFFPALWEHPFSQFAELVKRITQFPWPNNTLVAGEWVGPDNMPRWYFPVWFAVTVPVTYLVLFGFACIYLLKKYKHVLENQVRCFVVLFFGVTVGYIVIIHPNLYDSWRQLQFVLVLFLLICGYGLMWFFSRTTRGKSILAILAVTYHIAFCLWLHPFQFAYFNEAYLAFGKRNTFDQDYWNLSVHCCMNEIDKRRHGKPAKIYIYNSNGVWLNTFLYSDKKRESFISVNHRDTADFEIIPIRNSRPYQPGAPEVYHICPLKDTLGRLLDYRGKSIHRTY